FECADSRLDGLVLSDGQSQRRICYSAMRPTVVANLKDTTIKSMRMEILGFIMVLMGIIAVPFQYNIVQTLKKNGYNSTIFMFLPSDLKNYRKLIKSVNNEFEKRRMKTNYYGLIISWSAAITCFLSFIFIGLNS
ncbi:hypothetical protein, partial [Carboxylicivirga taeanensis]|uniref:hypothetical protein n=1 Tax=Carboxylicivirga taeanensis TaxID=1416875 RepID=UPI003F6DB2CC